MLYLFSYKLILVRSWDPQCLESTLPAWKIKQKHQAYFANKSIALHYCLTVIFFVLSKSMSDSKDSLDSDVLITGMVNR